MPHNVPLFKEHDANEATSREIERDSNFLTRRSSRRGTWGQCTFLLDEIFPVCPDAHF